MAISDFSGRFESLLEEIGTINPEREKGIRSAFDAVRAAQSSDSKIVVAALEGVKNSISPQFRSLQPHLVEDLTKLVDDEISGILSRTLPSSTSQETLSPSTVSLVSCGQRETQSSKRSKASDGRSQQSESSEKPSPETYFTDLPIFAIECIGSFLDLRTKQALRMATKVIHRHTQDFRISHAREIVESVYAPFGIRSQPIFTVEEANAFLLQTKSLVEKIVETLPEGLRSPLSSKCLVEDIEMLKTFFQKAYDFSLVQSFDDLAGVDQASPLDVAVRRVKEWLETTDLKQIQSLDLQDKKIPFVPREIGLFTSLVFLKLEACGVVLLPPEIGNLPALRHLILDYDLLTTLPPEIGNLPALQRFDVNSNRLTSLPPELGALPALRFLCLGDNHLTTVPPELGNLRNLEVLDLSRNRLTSLPPELGKASKLRVLWLFENHNISLPPEITNCPNLSICKKVAS